MKHSTIIIAIWKVGEKRVKKCFLKEAMLVWFKLVAKKEKMKEPDEFIA